jgi:hypothetical protein
MIDPVKYPERKHVVEINIQADDWNSVIGELRSVLFNLQTRDKYDVIDVSSGGPSGNHTVTARINPEQTHDKYFDELDVAINASQIVMKNE